MEFDIVKAILSKKEDFLRRHLVLSTSVIDKLRQYDVIGNYTKAQMTGNMRNTDRQLTHLFVCLRTRGLPAFNGFLKVLRLTFHGWLADDILETTIETGKYPVSSVGSIVAFRDVINHMHQSKIEPVREEVEKPSVHSQSRGIMGTLQNKCFGSSYEGADEDENLIRDEESGRVSPVMKIPRNLRDLERVFENESTSTRTSLATLRQEEIRIRALLQQNIREQQDLLSKQDALIEIKDKMKEISRSATQLFRPELATARLKKLESIKWKSKD